MEGDIIQEYEHPNNDKQWYLFIELKIKVHPCCFADTQAAESIRSQ